MRVDNLSTAGPDASIETDLAIIGGGPAGLTIARAFLGSSTRILVLESGLLREEPGHNDLNREWVV
jgi:flavin-dependent dehydrogenase